jgi:hypothetical protein
VKSVPLPEALWREIERTARSKRLNLHQASAPRCSGGFTEQADLDLGRDS